MDYDQGLIVIGQKKFLVTHRAGFHQCPPIGDVWSVQPEELLWVGELWGHLAFRDELRQCTVCELLEIVMRGPPIKQRVRRQLLVKRHIVDEEVEKMKLGVIRPSQSPWATTVTLAPQKDGSTRFCIDFRHVNVTVKDTHPLPPIGEIIDTLGGGTIFLAPDLKSAYSQTPLSEEAIPKTGFACHHELCEFTVLPYGLCNAPGKFQRIMQRILGDYVGTKCMVYLDDIIIFSQSEAEHMEHVWQALDRIGAAGMTLKMDKCQLGMQKLNFLGYTVSAAGKEPQEVKVEVIRSIPLPKSIKKVWSFLGMMGYYHQCIPGYALLAALPTT